MAAERAQLPRCSLCLGEGRCPSLSPILKADLSNSLPRVAPASLHLSGKWGQGSCGWAASPSGSSFHQSGSHLPSWPQSGNSARGQTDGRRCGRNEDIHVNITEQIDAQLDERKEARQERSVNSWEDTLPRERLSRLPSGDREPGPDSSSGAATLTAEVMPGAHSLVDPTTWKSPGPLGESRVLTSGAVPQRPGFQRDLNSFVLKCGIL